MPAFNEPAANADELREASVALPMRPARSRTGLRPTPVLGSIGSALASLSQSLHQLGEFHDGTTRRQAWINGDPDAGRAASHRESWELHRAAEMIHQVAEGVARAHQIEATTAYDIHDCSTVAPVQPPHQPGLSL